MSGLESHKDLVAIMCSRILKRYTSWDASLHRNLVVATKAGGRVEAGDIRAISRRPRELEFDRRQVKGPRRLPLEVKEREGRGKEFQAVLWLFSALS
jgi:hypothetical protein